MLCCSSSPNAESACIEHKSDYKLRSEEKAVFDTKGNLHCSMRTMLYCRRVDQFLKINS